MKATKFIIISALGLSLFSCKQADLSVSTKIEVPVSVIEVGTSSIEELVNATGTVMPIYETTLNSEMTGKYFLQKNPATGKPYALGDQVKQGNTLVKLEDAEYYNNLRIKSKEVDLEISKQEYEKQQSLYEKGGATLRALKNAEIGLINAEYDAEGSKIDLEKMLVTAPFSGVIADLPYFTPGVKVANNTELVTLINYDKLYLELSLPEKYFTNIERGLKVYITGYTNIYDTLLGKITQISPSIDPEARTFKSFVEINNPYNTLLPGMFVKADLVVNSSDSTIVIPKDIVISRKRDKLVYSVEKGYAVEKYITTGLESDNKIEVLAGLEIGESIVSKGFETLSNKAKVKILR